jgi:sulfite reductase (NADPH) hemoprotein beta-component
MSQVVIASRLSDGRVVFLSKGSTPGSVTWAPLLADAELAADETRTAELLSLGEADAEARHEVVDPYLIDVKEEGGELRPTKYREAIRCLGPTNRLDLGKQSEGAQA